MNSMSTKLKVAALVTLLGTATVAAAQSSSEAQNFTDQFQQLQALTSTGTYTFHPAPSLGNSAQDPVGNEAVAQRFADMQAKSSNDIGMWQETRPTLTATAADPEGREPFAQRFLAMEAASSNSGKWTNPAANGLTGEASGTLAVANPIGNVPPSHVVASN
jgi:hypothetical protein